MCRVRCFALRDRYPLLQMLWLWWRVWHLEEGRTLLPCGATIHLQRTLCNGSKQTSQKQASKLPAHNIHRRLENRSIILASSPRDLSSQLRHLPSFSDFLRFIFPLIMGVRGRHYLPYHGESWPTPSYFPSTAFARSTKASLRLNLASSMTPRYPH